MKTVVVIPTYNERENIKKLIPALFHLGCSDFSLVVVDDNSPDGTSEELIKFATQFPITLIKRPKKLGLGSAYVSGFTEALRIGADLVVEMDADLSHKPTDIPRLISACEDGADLAIGSRRVPGGGIEGWGPIRHMMSAGAMSFARIILQLKTHDVTAGFRCFRRQVLTSINLDTINSSGYAFQEEVLYRTEQKKFRVVELPTIFIDRLNGKSKLSHKDILEFFLTILRLRLQKKLP